MIGFINSIRPRRILWQRIVISLHAFLSFLSGNSQYELDVRFWYDHERWRKQIIGSSSPYKPNRSYWWFWKLAWWNKNQIRRQYFVLHTVCIWAGVCGHPYFSFYTQLIALFFFSLSLHLPSLSSGLLLSVMAALSCPTFPAAPHFSTIFLTFLMCFIPYNPFLIYLHNNVTR